MQAQTYCGGNMRPTSDSPESEQPQDQKGFSSTDSFPSRLSKSLSEKVEEARQGLQRSNEAIAETADSVKQGMQQTGTTVSEATETARQNLQRSGEVLTGADLRKFDEFTEAVTRACIGLYHDELDSRKRLELLEELINQVAQTQGEIIERLTQLERSSISQ